MEALKAFGGLMVGFAAYMAIGFALHCVEWTLRGPNAKPGCEYCSYSPKGCGDCDWIIYEE